MRAGAVLQKEWMPRVRSLRAVRVQPTQEVGVIIWCARRTLAISGFSLASTRGKPQTQCDSNEQHNADDDPNAKHARKSTQSQRRRLSDVKRIPAWLTYTLLRLVFFVVPFAVLWAVGFQAWMAAILAAVIGLSLSIIFLTKFRNATSTSIAKARDSRTPRVNVDEEAEDSLS
jgi:hypothetical protein